jgi:uncharacterized protein YkwD
VLAGALPVAGQPARAADAPSRTGFGAALLHELNRVRALHRLPAVRGDRAMSRTAGSYAREMARLGVFAHGAWSGRVAHAAKRPRSIGEVLGWLTPATPRDEAVWLVRQWLASPVHRPVVLGAGFRRIGVGRATGTLDGAPAAIYTLDFASARPLAPR